jgi:fibronectin-binding autotransporter adhesin
MSLPRHFLCLAASTLMVNAGVNYYYLDLNGNASGFGTLNATWSLADPVWTLDSQGLSVPVAHTFSSDSIYDSTTGWAYDVAVFSAGSVSGNLSIADGRKITVYGITDNVGQTISAQGTGYLALRGNGPQGVTIGAGISSTISAPIYLDTQNTTSLTVAGTLSLSGAISNSPSTPSYSGGLKKLGVGLAILSGANSYIGDTTIDAGTLRLVGAQSVTSGNYTVSYPAALELEGGLTVPSVRAWCDGISGAGAVISRSGSNTISLLTLSWGFGGLSGTKIVALAGSTLTLNSVVSSGTPHALYVGGDGDVVIGSAPNLYTLTKIGNGNLRFSPGAVMQWSGGAGITGGSISSRASSLYSLGLSISSGTLEFTQDIDESYSGTLSGSGNIRKTGAGILTLSTNTNTFSGGVSVEEGTLKTGVAGAVPSGSALSVLAGATFDMNSRSTQISALSGGGQVNLGSATLTLTQTSAQTFGGVISGTGSLTKSGSYNLTLTGNNTFSGTLSATGGILHVGVGGTSGSIASSLVLSSASTEVVFNRSDDITYAGNISGSGIVNKRGSGRTALSGSNTFTGGLNITSGVLAVASPAPLGGGTILLSGGTLASTATFSVARALNLATFPASSGTIDVLSGNTLTWAGTASGAGSLVKSGEGTLILSGTNTYAGSTTVSSGTLKLGAAGAIPSGSQLIVLAGASVDYNGFAPAIGGLTSAPSGLETLTVPLSGNGTITMNGTGTLVLASANTNTGGVVVNSGTIKLEADNALPSPTSVSLAAGSFLDLNGHDATFSALSGAGTMLLGGSDLTLALTSMTTFGGTIAEAGNVTKSGSFNLYLTGDNSMTGTLTSAGGFIHVGVGGISGSLSADVVLSTPSSELVFNRYDNLTYGGSISGAGSVNQYGSGVLTLAGTNTFTGGLDITSGTVSVSSVAALGTGPVLVSRGTLATTASFSSARSLNLSTYPANYGTIDVASGTTLGWSGQVTGGGRLIKTGGGSLSLSGNNTFSGTTLVQAGTVESFAATALGSASVQVDAGGVLRASSTNANAVSVASGGAVEGAGTLGSVTIDNGGILSPGAPVGVLTASSLTPRGGSTLVWQVRDADSALGTGYDGMNVTGGVDLSQSGQAGGKISLKIVSLSSGATPGNSLNFDKAKIYSFGIIDASSFNFGANANLSDIFQLNVSDFRYDDGSMSSASLWSLQYDAGSTMVTLTAVPEPSTYALGLSALGMAAALVRRRRMRPSCN